MNLRKEQERKRKVFFDQSSSKRPASKRSEKGPSLGQNSEVDDIWKVPSGSFIVKEIVDHKRVANSLSRDGLDCVEYRVCWEGYSASSDTWLPYCNVSHLSALQHYITDCPELRNAMKNPTKSALLEPEEGQDVVEALAANLLRSIREQSLSRQCHKDEEECFSITVVRCFFPNFKKLLQFWHTSRSELYTIDFKIWCPERSFDAFLKTCVTWAVEYKNSPEEQDLVTHEAHMHFSDTLLAAGLASERRSTVNFQIGATAAPFHVLGNVAEDTIPFRQSPEPWYVYAWKTEESVHMPYVDELSSTTISTTTVIHCRMIVGMVTVTYNRDKQALGISARYCEVQASRSHLSSGFTPVGCDTQSIAAVSPIIMNKARLLAQKLALSEVQDSEE